MTIRRIFPTDEEVRAMLRDRNPQTQFRVPIKLRPHYEQMGFFRVQVPTYTDSKRGLFIQAMGEGDFATLLVPHCPFGQEGDRVRACEAWAFNPHAHPSEAEVLYRATDPDWDQMEEWSWNVPQRMPCKHSRLFFDITGVRAARVCRISQDDALAMGMYGEYISIKTDTMGTKYGKSVVEQYRDRWIARYGEESWGNDWCWVLSIMRVAGDET